MEWIREGEVPFPDEPGEPDSLRAWRPWVLEEPDGAGRMWYTGSDGTTTRILTAERPAGGAWERQGRAIDAGFAGDSDSYGAESPCVVKTPGGYLMVYGGFDGEVSRLHMATSRAGRLWESQGTIMQRGPEDVGGANDPCLLVTGERWWLFYTGARGDDDRRTTIMAAVSQSGASWDRIGPVLEPEASEVAVSHPCAIEISRRLHLFFASAKGGQRRIALATSPDGVSWDRRGTVLEPAGDGPDASGVHTPCVVRLRDGSLRMWYAGLPTADESLGYRICSARFPGPWSL
ncbi:MAG TPA: hypothetical protein VF129_00295 [Actinomycetota bacterium]